MTCAGCEQLRAELAAARAELADWKAWDRDPIARDRLALWQDALHAPFQVIALLILLADARERVVSPDRLVEATRRIPDAKTDDPHRTLAPVIVWKARRALDACGLGGAIETFRGLGYLMPLGARERLLAYVGEAA